jgi:glutathione S-transferase
MHPLILHHYDLSPYAEKVRLVFGLKALPWRSVRIPIVMPKPDLVELTGGYRRTPTLQVGADIYCDTKVIARALERIAPNPTLYPDRCEAILPGLSRWAETSFMMVVTAILGLGGTFDEAFLEDRRKMLPGADFSKAKLIVPAKLLQLRANLDLLERQLGDGRSFLLGSAPSLADLSAYHPLAFTRVHPKLRGLTAPLARVSAWMDRVAAIGHGKREEMESAEAIEIAREAKPAAWEGEEAELPEGLAWGERVAVLPEEPGSGTVLGELLPSDLHEIRIARRSERAGDLVVHLPREDYLVVRAS